ncbi:ranBP-type and C3HC4-type zinc finger-containing protein 1-like isoform X1 [Haliotis rubra]|uniref:ranBP-type and C3HC4-type zinc finger-containing protein 1-like isoform X1 n=2 Tax=Haliotis rubra TaxID=36100 RepID=UPI001EE4F8D9|nr:ranBP-type and C3HC4-type zinc finger-containing protein 1-like isoform X1 [Haliotis rubra]XP_046542360.1 ranBP-type and C3HC4-type zinc finger-containing protein 1-like isoform X1 [Haliotis rubra]
MAFSRRSEPPLPPVLLREGSVRKPEVSQPRSRRLSQYSASTVLEAQANCIASCDCTVNQPITVPVDAKWENTKSNQDDDARPMVSSEDNVVYLYHSDDDGCYHITVLKNRPGADAEIFLTFSLEGFASGGLKYNIKGPYWHHVCISENNKEREFVFKLEKGQQGDIFTQKVKDVLHILEQGHVTRQHDTETEIAKEKFPAVFFYKRMDDPSMQSGLPRGMQPTPPEHLRKILELLQAAILAGDGERAKQIAHRLAVEKVKLDIKVDETEIERRRNEPSISVKVHVEDRETSGCPVNLKVKPSDTIGDLKRKMFLEYEFPVEVQRWIIGRKIPQDRDTLHRCNIRSSGHTVYLYLATARSVNLEPNQMDTMNTLGRTPPEMSGDYMTMANFRQSQRGQGGAVQRSSRPPSRQQSNVSTGSGSTPSQFSEAASPESFVDPLRASGSVPSSRPNKGLSLNVGRGQAQFQSFGRGQGQFQSSGRGQGQNVGRGQAQGGGRGQGQFPGMGRAHGPIHSPPEFLEEHVLISSSPPGATGGGVQSAVSPESSAEIGWQCPACTFINKPTRPGCEVCGGDRPPDYEVPIGYIMTKEELCWLADREDQERLVQEAEEFTRQQERQRSTENFNQLLELENRDLVPNTEVFDCPICFDTIAPGEGVVLRECLHLFCQDCLMNAVRMTEEASLKCPFQDDLYTCEAMLQDREVRALVSDEIYARYLQRSLDTAESQASNSYHCKTPDCHGWCIYEDLVNFFSCPVCRKENCLTCKAIHENMNCREYQEDLKRRSSNDKAAQQTQKMLERLVTEGEAMPCPQCKVIVQKKDGCDWIKCSICKTEICWVTKGPRWGPKGEGDISGGCGCRVNGAKCDPQCNNCH